MESTPMISVIIPVYNCEEYVAEAIESVIKQPYQNIDLVLVNDGSTDSSPEICNRYATSHERIHVIHQSNSGVSAARNAGIEYVLEAGYDGYIAFLDADDKWADSFFTEKSLDLFRCGYDLIGFQTARCNHSATRRCVTSDMKEGNHNGGAQSVWLNSKQTFGAAFYGLPILKEYSIRFPNGLKVNEDVIFSMQYKYLAEQIYLSNKLLYLYRNNALSVSHKKVNAIQKFEPVINAYLLSDKAMLEHSN